MLIKMCIFIIKFLSLWKKRKQWINKAAQEIIKLRKYRSYISNFNLYVKQKKTFCNLAKVQLKGAKEAVLCVHSVVKVPVIRRDCKEIEYLKLFGKWREFLFYTLDDTKHNSNFCFLKNHFFSLF